MPRLLNNNAMAEVLAFLYGHWKREWKTVFAIAFSMAIATVADLFLPVFSGRLIDAITPQNASREKAFHDALLDIPAMAGLGAVLAAARSAPSQPTAARPCHL